MAEKPELLAENEKYYMAFSVLNRTRDCGFSANPITLSEITAYADIHGVVDRRTLMRRVMAADLVFMDYCREKEAARSKR